MPVSPVTPNVKPKGGQRRVLLLTSETALEAEVRDALRIRQQEREPGLFFELTYLDPTSLTDFLAVLDLLDRVRQGYFDMVHIVPSASTWSRSCLSEHSGQPLPSAQDLLHWVSLHFRQTRPRRSTRPIELWKSQFGSRSNRSNAHQNSFVSILFSLKTWEDIVYMVPLPYGYYGSFVSLRAYVTLCVQLPKCASSPDRNTNVQLEFSPTVPLSVLFCFWAGQTWLKFRTVSSTKGLCPFPVHVAVSILLLLA